MTRDGKTESRFGGLAGGLWVREEAVNSESEASGNSALARTLDGFCETVLWAGGRPPPGAPGRRVAELDGAPGPLRALAAILAASELDRVLFVNQGETEIERLLALVAYPRQDLAVYRPGRGKPIAAVLCEREPVLAGALRQLSAGRVDLESVCSAFDSPSLEGRSD